MLRIVAALALLLSTASAMAQGADPAPSQPAETGVTIPPRLARQVVIFLRQGGAWDQAVALADDMTAALRASSHYDPKNQK
jgi:hypothetical protein